MRAIAGLVFVPETFSVPDRLPLRETPEAAANGASSKFVNLNEKSRGDLPEIVAEPEPLIVPCPLLALRLPRVSLSPSLPNFALTPENVAPLAVNDFAERLRLILSSLVKSPLSAVVSSISLAVTMSIA